ncbi:MAG: HAD hydrolase family protein [Candidatus Lokiarchaeota archaeon]|nr:HAD hydrolase family protein [Candidatus Lokiarchaeota archaeon]
MTIKNVCCWDLEGPISVLDFAAELGKLLCNNLKLGLQKYDSGEFYKMLSKYDDYLIEVPGIKEELNIPDYQPGDTLRLIAPLYMTSFSDEDLVRLAKRNLGLLPGCKDLMEWLHKDWDVYIISTSYSHFAYNIAEALKIPYDHVFCTELNIKSANEEFHNIKNEVDKLVKNIFQKFIVNNKNLKVVIKDLNEFFWKTEESDYLKAMNLIKVRGGKRKELAVETISKQTHIPISELVVLGDSITDINMLQRLKDEDGVAVSFNGNRFTVNRANIAITTPNNLGTLPIFKYKDKIEPFLESWEFLYNKFKNNPQNIPDGLISKEIKRIFIKYQFVPELENLKNKTKDELDLIITKHEMMRKKVRGWVGNLG